MFITDGALFSPPKLEAETMINRQSKIDAGMLNIASGLNKALVTSSRDYLAEMLLQRTKEKKKKCEAGLLKNFCQF